MRRALSLLVFVLSGCAPPSAPSPPACHANDDCGAGASPCEVARCAAGACLTALLPPGTEVPGSPRGNCRRATCDAEGAVVAEDDPTDTPAPRDHCSRPVCVEGRPGYVTRSGEACGGGGVCTTAAGCVRPRSLALRDARSCVVTEDGGVFCWGATGGGFPGGGEPSATAAPVRVPGIEEVSALSLGPSHACGLLLRGGVACWGADSATRSTARAAPYGGRGTVTFSSPLYAVLATRAEHGRVPGLDDSLSVAASDGESCAIGAGHRVRCLSGGTHPLTPAGHGPEPLDVTALAGSIGLAGGATHSCAVQESGSVRCWGANAEGQLGDGSRLARDGVVEVTGVTRAVEVAVGGAHSCALTAEGRVLCWGYGASGELGDGVARSSPFPRLVTLRAAATQLALGASHSCALLEDGRVACWGQGTSGELGDGNDTPIEPIPRTVRGTSDAVAIAAGAHHTCALRRGRSVRCWGSNAEGQCGQPSTGVVRVATEITW